MNREEKIFISLKYGIPCEPFSDSLNTFSAVMKQLPEDFLMEFRYGTSTGIILTGNRFHQRFTEPLYLINLYEDLAEYDTRRQDALHP